MSEPPNEPSHTAFRLTILSFALLLGLQSVWLLAELYQPGIYRLPTAAADAIDAQNERGDAALAATIGVIRGDLWAKFAYTYAYLLFGDRAEPANKDLTATLAQASVVLDHALDDAPHESGVWLLRAGLALRYPALRFNAPEALKMSYYTGSSEQDLMPLRLRIAAQLDSFRDVEIPPFVTRDLHILTAQNRKTAVIDAYKAGSPSGKRFIEQAVTDIDPSALSWLRAGAR
jgi:hypothetical protein